MSDQSLADDDLCRQLAAMTTIEQRRFLTTLHCPTGGLLGDDAPSDQRVKAVIDACVASGRDDDPDQIRAALNEFQGRLKRQQATLNSSEQADEDSNSGAALAGEQGSAEPKKTFSEQELQTLYQEISKEVNDLLNSNPDIAEFLREAATGFVELSSKPPPSCSLSNQVFAADFSPLEFLKKTRRRLDQHGCKSIHRLDKFDQVVCGITACGLSPHWFQGAKQRMTDPSVALEVPDEVLLGGKVTVSLLHYLSSVLVGGIGRLDGIFNMEAMEKLIRAPAAFEGTNPEDKMKSLKLHIVACIQNVEFTQEISDQYLGKMFRNIQGVVLAANEDTKEPWFALVDEELELWRSLGLHGLLIFSTKESCDSEAVLPAAVRVLTQLKSIKDILSREPV